MDMALGGRVDVHMGQARPRRRVDHRQPRLLRALADGRLGGQFTRFDVPTGLEPPMESTVPVQDHPAGTDHEGRGGDVGRVGPPVEGTVQPR